MKSSVDLNWLLDDLVNRNPAIQTAIVLSRDGLASGSSALLDREDAERLAAIAAGFHSLARGAVGYLGARQVRQIVVDMAGGYLFITAAGENGCLAVVTKDTADLGLIAYETALLVKRISAYIQPLRQVPLGGGAT
jgi:predicted regulator of Ras-like GTPase activity (Roadblock/LC7/MglB family)